MSIDRFAPPEGQKDETLFRWAKFFIWGLTRTGKTRRRFVRKANLAFPHATFRAFRAQVKAQEGKVFVDLGANVGEFTTAVAPHASRVIAVEPDPWTAGKLRAAVAGLDNVTVIEAAVGAEAGEITLFRPARFAQDPENYSVGCTTQPGVEDGETLTVRQIAIDEILDGIEDEIGIVKIDIEGAEVPVLEHLLNKRPDLMARIGALFVETHEKQMPDLEIRSRKLRLRMWARRALLRRRIPFVSMNWW